MRGDEKGRVDNGILLHPTDSKACERLDEVYPRFKAEARMFILG